ncbi:hypothetical protein jhhlp_006602, partial [Lomentospora prolificans]
PKNDGESVAKRKAEERNGGSETPALFRMRIACLQFNPHLGDVNNNLTRADRVLSRANPENLDLIVLPEMAFTGYNFKALSEVHSYLEPTGAGISALWARTTALKYNCHVVVGYPEKADVSHKWPTSPEYYNSAIVIGPDGEDVANYRKTHLYYTDETWALEGNRGFYGDHITGLGQTAIGICMDINPYKFQEPWDRFEFAYHVLNSDANLVIVSMAWLTVESQTEFSTLPHEPDMNTLTYWAMRMEPVIRAEMSDEIIFVFANRCGSEGGAVYAGTSAVLGVKDGEVNVYGVLGRGEKKVLIADTNQPPVAKLVLGNQGGSIRPTDSATVDPTIPHMDGTAASVSHQREYEEVLAGPRHARHDLTASWAATQVVELPPLSHQESKDYKDLRDHPKDPRSRPESRGRKGSRNRKESIDYKEPRDRKESRNYESGDRRESRDRKESADHMQKARERTREKDTERIFVSTPVKSTPTSNGVLKITHESSLGKTTPLKLTIPETPSRTWQKADTPIYRATGTPFRKRSTLESMPESGRQSRLPDSAVVVSAVEPSMLGNGLISPQDSALGRATPDVLASRAYRKSSSRKSSQPKDTDPRAYRSSSRLQTEQGPKHNIETIEEDPSGLTKAKLDARFKDGPDARAPSAALLSYWFETLPTSLPEVPEADPIEPRAPSVSVAEFERKRATPAATPAPIANTPSTKPAPTASVQSHAPVSMSSMGHHCHQCGQAVNSERDASRARSQSYVSLDKSSSSGAKEGVHMQGTSERSLTMETQNSTAAADDALPLLTPMVYQATAKIEMNLDDIPFKVDIGEIEQPDETPLASKSLELKGGTEKSTESIAKETMEKATENTPEEVQAKAAEEAAAEVQANLEPVEESQREVPTVVHVPQNNDVPLDGDGKVNEPIKLPTVTATEVKVATNAETQQEQEFDPMAPRTRVVPPSVKGLEKPAVVIVRPTSVYW